MPKILIVEDNPHHYELLRRELPEHHLTNAPRASDAVRLLEREAFDLVIADVALPDSVGDSTLQTLRQFAPRLLAMSSVVQKIDTEIPFITKDNFTDIAGKANKILNKSSDIA